MATKETYKITKDFEHVDKPKTKYSIKIDLKVKYIWIFNEALLKYLGPEYKSRIQVGKTTKAFIFFHHSKDSVPFKGSKDSVPFKGSKDSVPFEGLASSQGSIYDYDFNDQLYQMTILSEDLFIIPTTSLKRLLVVDDFPENEVLFIEYKTTGTVVFSFLRFEDGEIKLSSPFLEDGVDSGDEIPCKYSDDITSYLNDKNPIESLLEFFSNFFSLGNDPDLEPFQWELVGTDQDCKISQKVGTTVFYWKDTEVDNIVKAVDSEAEAMSFKMDLLV